MPAMTVADRRAFREEGEDDDDEFFDSRDDLSSAASDSCLDDDFVGWAAGDLRFDVCVESLGSVRERRSKFMRWMGLDSVDGDGELADGCAPLRSSNLDNAACFMSSRSSEDSNGSASTSRSSEDPVLDENSCFSVKNLDDDDPRSIHKVSSNRNVLFDEFNRSFGPSLSEQQVMQQNGSTSTSSSTSSSETMPRKCRRMEWFRRLGVAACLVDREVEESNLNLSDSNQIGSSRIQRVKVRPYRKQVKEFSAVYRGQDIRAHDGAILTMKFSPDGQHLASGGEDGVVRVWCVMECEQRDEDDVPMDDPSCIYFTVNCKAELAPLTADKEKKSKSRSMKRTSDSACVVIPPEVFRISEKPVHEFHGHNGDVLDLSWSKDKYLLSSSTDKTVRLWQVGCNSCLKVFAHNDYVTCVQFNPVDENYFISGSIDDKVRVWEIPQCRVVDWIDTKEIVTAVCYRPDGKGVVVGSMAGDCRFYDASDNHLQLDAQISLQGKKKSPFKRITGCQFCPTDHQKLMVTSADSHIRILDGVDVVSKYRGFRNAGSQISASFTSDGCHIISASEDSNVYIWTHINQYTPSSYQAKSTWSCEHFRSCNVSVAIPWHGLESTNPALVTSDAISSQQDALGNQRGDQQRDSVGNNALYLSPVSSFTLSREFFSEVLPKGSATWPEEKLPSSLATTPALCRSQYKFLKASCQKTSHAWGQVIVSGGWDGRIRSFQNYGLPLHL